jgi:hypothetical protein
VISQCRCNRLYLTPPQTKKNSFTVPRPTPREGKPDGGGLRRALERASLEGLPLAGFTDTLGQPDLIDDLPLLGITDACRVKPIGELVG